MNVDLRDQGTIFFATPDQLREHPGLMADCPLPSPLAELEPVLAHVNLAAIYLKERSVDPRTLTSAALKAARHRGVGHCFRDGRHRGASGKRERTGVGTERTSYSAPVVVNCAGAWAGQLPPLRFPTRPVKGQMLSVVGTSRDLVAPCHSRSRSLSGSAQRRPHPGRRDHRRSWIRQAHRRRHDPAHAPGGDPTGSRSGPGAHAGGLGRIAARFSAITCPFSGPRKSRLLRRDGSLPRWHPARRRSPRR